MTEAIEAGFRRCAGCNTVRKVKFFSKNRRRPDGLQDSCKFCQAERYQKNRETILARMEARRRDKGMRAHPPKVAKVLRPKKHVPTDAVTPHYCPSCEATRTRAEFSIARNRATGLCWQCRWCDKAANLTRKMKVAA